MNAPNEKSDSIPSRANIAGHPIHPMVIAFPIAFLCAAPLTDLAHGFTGEAFWARVSFWLLLSGFVTGLFASVFGLIDFMSNQKIRSHSAAWIHFLGNAVALALTAVNFWPRINFPQSFILPLGLALSFLTTFLLGITGWYGGELSYRHRIGVMNHH